MRFIICFTILFALTNGQKHLFSREEGFKKVHEECQSDSTTHLDEEVFAKYRNGEEVEDKNLGLHIFCMNTKLNIQGKDGEINKDQIKRYLQYVFHPYVINDIVEECGTSEGESKYVVGKILYKCLHKYADHVHNRQYHEKREHEYKTAYKECHYNELDTEEQRKFLLNKNFDSFKLRKFVHCCAKKLKIVKENGELNEEVVKHDLQDRINEKGKVKEIIKQCSVISSEDLEEEAKAVKMFKCLINHSLSYQKDEYNRGRERRERHKKMYEECQADPDTKADRVNIKKFTNGEEVTDPQLGHYFLCIDKKLGIRFENGGIDRESIKKYLETYSDDEERITKVLNKCANKNPHDSEVVFAQKLFMCLHVDSPWRLWSGPD